jgi:large conductance mechanosensitive channel
LASELNILIVTGITFARVSAHGSSSNTRHKREFKHPDHSRRVIMLEGFKSFILKGNVVDLAVGVVIGAAFGKIVDSLVKNLITPIIGAIGGSPDFSAIKLGPILIGNVINDIVSFVILAAVVYFVIVVPYNASRPKVVEAPAGPTQEELLAQIRDLLKK